MKFFAIFVCSTIALVSICGCSTKVLRTDLVDKISKKPQLVDFHDRWVLGFARKTYTDPVKACLSEIPVMVKDTTSAEDILIGLLTFGIYVPATTQVWCLPQPEPTTPSNEI